ncbi:uncharacterized protein RCC_04804 [Ramularia collo-cygni]|uniref:F-box domain-containing protein n=1 Tax=Ramularia collo-cygni TaxID=112498 RepID=A0A2D3VBJ1_9PEZI|nr:uncharacterized protein RCC_04804 [Ramularia collo-cygni]CZT18959.1 uncharacterized protein RCC_04804 [Ramularia collo-cygni]
MASLETLPAPLPLQITKHLADLISLHALCLSCPLFATVFANHAAEIFEHLMNKCLAEEVIVELRAYILLRTQDRAIQDLEGLYSAAQKPLVRTTPAPAIRHTLHVFAMLSTTCNSIFDTKLRRLYALPHQHFADKSSNRFPGNYEDNIHLQPGRLFKPPLLPSSPDWDEQQRLLRATWRLKVWTALGHSDGSLADTVPTIDSIPSAEFAGVARVGGGVNEGSMDELLELASSLEEIGTCDRIAWEPLATKPILQPEARQMAREVRGSYGYAFFNRACQGLQYSPLMGADWAVMRRLGFGIWSTRRLRIMGYKSKDRQQLGQREPIIQEGEELGKRDAMFTWNCLYRTAVGESLRRSGADMSRYRDDAE